MDDWKRRGAEAPLALNNVRVLRFGLRWYLLSGRLQRIGAERDTDQLVLQSDGGKEVDLSAIDLIHGHLCGLVHHLGVHTHSEDAHSRQFHAVAIHQEVDKRLTDGIHSRRQLRLVDTGVLRRQLQHFVAIDLRVGDRSADITLLVQDSDPLKGRVHFHFAHRFTIIKR